MKRQSLLVVSFVLLCCSSGFSQELSTSKATKEKPAKIEEKSLNRAKPLSSNAPLQTQKKDVKVDASKKEEQVLDKKTTKISPKKPTK